MKGTTKMKFYFKDRNGKELSDHKLHGIEAGSEGSSITTTGIEMCDAPMSAIKWKDSKGRIARFDIGALYGDKITIEDFPGHDAVIVTAWAVGQGEGKRYREEFWLISKEAAEKIRDKCS